MRLGIIGATGLVGREILKVLEKFNLPLKKVNLYASDKSAGKTLNFAGKNVIIQPLKNKITKDNDVFISSAGSAVAGEWGEKIKAEGLLLIDNSSRWRMDPEVPLVVPEINGERIFCHKGIIANPNCSTIQLVLALNPLRRKYGIERIVVSTYQSVTGSGEIAVRQLENELGENLPDQPKAYNYPIAYNAIPHIDVFLADGYTREERKMIDETQKIFAEKISVTATCVRIPTLGGHGESVNVQFKKPYSLSEVKRILEEAPGITVMDDPGQNIYPMPLFSRGKDEVFVG
jgi:aspartate-semialdehyde dehydrogenase